jgi:hypothetical protein
MCEPTAISVPNNSPTCQSAVEYESAKNPIAQSKTPEIGGDEALDEHEKRESEHHDEARRLELRSQGFNEDAIRKERGADGQTLRRGRDANDSPSVEHEFNLPPSRSYE